MTKEGEECWKEIVKYHKNIFPILHLCTFKTPI